MSQAATLNIVFVLFPKITQLDFTGPAQCVSRMPGARVFSAAEDVTPIPTDSGFSIVPSVAFSSCPQADILCVPGGHGVAAAIEQKTAVSFVGDQAKAARWLTAVCTGSFILGAAGLLRGKRATTHWAYTHLLSIVGATHEQARIVKDGNVITAGGVTSGIDFGLRLIGEVAGQQAAQAIQLALEYDPAPPFSCGTPSTAAGELVRLLRSRTYDAAAAELEKALRHL